MILITILCIHLKLISLSLHNVACFVNLDWHKSTHVPQMYIISVKWVMWQFSHLDNQIKRFTQQSEYSEHCLNWLKWIIFVVCMSVCTHICQCVLTSVCTHICQSLTSDMITAGRCNICLIIYTVHPLYTVAYSYKNNLKVCQSSINHSNNMKSCNDCLVNWLVIDRKLICI